MKNKSKPRSRTARLIFGIFNIPFWFDWARTKSFTLFLKNGFERLFVPKREQESSNSFDSAQKKLKITDAELLLKQKALFRLSILMAIVACIIFSYFVYHLFFGTYKAALVSFVVTFVALALSFRYHFWYFQIKNRKLGCTFIQWFRQSLLGEKE